MTSEEKPSPSAREQRDIDAQAQAWARRFAGGRPTTVDAEAFKAWRGQSAAHASAWAVASREWRDIDGIAQAFRARHPGLDRAPAARRAVEDARKGQARQAARIAAGAAAQLGNFARGGWRPGRRAFLGAGLSSAGALTVLAAARPPLGLWPSWSELNSDYRTATGEQRSVDVNDRIHVVLNTQTSVSVQTRGDVPCVEIVAGEAAVRTRGDAPMDVLAGAGRIRMIDAAIEVRKFDQSTRVICSDGHAELHFPGRTVVLDANQEIYYDDRRMDAPQARRAQDDSSWREGMVVFDAMPLSDAVAEINRYRPGRVVLLNDGLATRRISGRFRIAALDQAIQQIEALYGAHARRLGDVTLLS